MGWTRLDCEEARGLLYCIVLYYTGDMHNAMQCSAVQCSDQGLPAVLGHGTGPVPEAELTGV